MNLGADLPDGGEPFERIIEIVPVDGEERQRARARWRAYEAQWLDHPAPSAGGGVKHPVRAGSPLHRGKKQLSLTLNTGQACQSRIILGTSFFTGTPS